MTISLYMQKTLNGNRVNFPEKKPHNPLVVGSSPTGPTIFFLTIQSFTDILCRDAWAISPLVLEIVH